MKPAKTPSARSQTRKVKPSAAAHRQKADAMAFRERRQLLREQFPNTVIVLAASSEAERGEIRTGYFQDTNFHYLTGFRRPGATLLITPSGEGMPAEILFLPDRDATHELWSGLVPDATDALVSGETGIRVVRRRSQLEATLNECLATWEKLACVSGSPAEQQLRQAFPLREMLPLNDALGRLRMKKAEGEIARMREAIRITAEGQLRGWHSLQKSTYEYEVAADITHEFLRLGAERHAFAPIVASGARACVLHYSNNREALPRATLTILDVGAERERYCGDLTRTVPVRARFSRRQQQLYEAVLAVQKEVIAAVRPGAYIGRQVPGSLHHLAVARFAEMRLGDRGKPLSEFFPHGIGHHLGLDVHDLSDPMAPLAPGMVVTIEPGVYLPQEGIGIRIEDDVLVTETGCEVLSSALPKEVHELEAIVRP
jgi:Xaa-Pro aminopeptidase